MRRIIFVSIFMLTVVSYLWSQKSNKKLIYTPEQIEYARERVTIDSVMQVAWQEIRSRADVLSQKREINQTNYLSLVYLMTGDERYAEEKHLIFLRCQSFMS